MDFVHVGDRDGRKGIYLVNIVDEVTEYEFVGAVAAISERFLMPLLEGLLDLFPFVIKGFHADNGSEYINHRVADLLNKLHVEFTKSRPRHSNDNALVEGKNGHVVRKQFGHDHIPQRHAALVDDFAQQQLSPFLNYHRPCLFPVEYRDPAAKIRRRYPRQGVTTPYEALKSLDDAHTHLKSGLTFAQLDAVAYAESDLAAAKRLNDARRELFGTVFGDPLAA